MHNKAGAAGWLDARPGSAEGCGEGPCPRSPTIAGRFPPEKRLNRPRLVPLPGPAAAALLVFPQLLAITEESPML